METVLVGGRVLLPDGTLEETDVTLSGGKIAAIGEAPTRHRRDAGTRRDCWSCPAWSICMATRSSGS